MGHLSPKIHHELCVYCEGHDKRCGVREGVKVGRKERVALEESNDCRAQGICATRYARQDMCNGLPRLIAALTFDVGDGIAGAEFAPYVSRRRDLAQACVVYITHETRG